MLLSVIIVNYNVKHFLEQCLYSLQLATGNIESEIIVIDNHSSDGSIEYLQPLFPNVAFIRNTFNPGFARANNQAFGMAMGKYILFLNPDTLVPKDCLTTCINYMDSTGDAGAIGISMLDGSGKFLPESKRSFPSPLTSLFKLLGLSALFPTSRLFAKYHLGYLDKNNNQEVDVLAGAFMMTRRAVLINTGLFDESFFMYGEDVDLSYRIQKNGWKNIYVADASIIHFKGESTKKGSLNYVRLFYQAMHLFVKKHYGSSSAWFFRFFIQVAIWLRAVVSAMAKLLKKAGLPLFDVIITLCSLAGVARLWNLFVKPGIEYKREVMYFFLPLFTITFIISGAIAGLYDRSYKPIKAFIAMMIAVMVNLAIYSMLDIDHRFSRGVMLFGGLFASLCILLFRKILVETNVMLVEDESREYRQTIVAGTTADFERVTELMARAERNERVLGRVSTGENEPHTLGNFQNLDALLKEIPAREIVFCISEKLPLASVISFMQQQRRVLRYKFYYSGSGSIVGSDSKETSGETIADNAIFKIASPENRRMKRVSDLLWSLMLFFLLPVNLFIVKQPLQLIRNIFLVIAGNKTWVGYCGTGKQLPALKKPVIGCNGQPVSTLHVLSEESAATIDYWYARDYEWLEDSRIIIKSYRHLGS